MAVLRDDNARYDSCSILLHWLTAGLVVLQWCSAWIVGALQAGPERVAARSLHVVFGVSVVITLVLRLIWSASASRRAPPTGPGFFGRAARIVHRGLYVLLAGTVVLGAVNVWMTGDRLFGLLGLEAPEVARPGHTLQETIQAAHGWLALAVVVVAGLHASAALIHHFLMRDDVMRRMLPSRIETSRNLRGRTSATGKAR